MSITLVAVVIALVLGHVAPAAVKSLRHYGWYGGWLRWLGAQANSSFWRGRWGIALALLLPLLLVGVLQWWLDKWWFGLPGLLFDIVVLVYAWGPRDLDIDVETVIDGHDTASRNAAITNLWPQGENVHSDGPALVEAVFGSAMKRWFGVLLWFALLGPFGALLYRLTERSSVGEFAQSLPENNLAGVRKLCALLEWPAAQLMTLGMALVGNFDVVRQAWRNAGGNRMNLDNNFLAAAARASVKSELAEEAEEYAEEGITPALRELPELRDAMSLVWRILLLWLAVLAVFGIGGWVR
jgi:AmpE protein